MKYWFIFSKTDLLLKKRPDGSLTIPQSEKNPLVVKPSTHIMEVEPMPDGDAVRTYALDDPTHIVQTANENGSMYSLASDHLSINYPWICI